MSSAWREGKGELVLTNSVSQASRGVTRLVGLMRLISSLRWRCCKVLL